MNFLGIGISLPSFLYSTKQDSVFAFCAAKKVMFDGEQTSLSAATRTVPELKYRTAPGPYRTYEERLLRDIYSETYTEAK